MFNLKFEEIDKKYFIVESDNNFVQSNLYLFYL